MTASNLSEIRKEEANILAGKTKEEPPVLSTEDQELKQLEDRRIDLRKKENRSQRERERENKVWTKQMYKGGPKNRYVK